MGHMGGLKKARPRRGQYRAGFSNTGGSPKLQKRAQCQKKVFQFSEFARQSSLSVRLCA